MNAPLPDLFRFERLARLPAFTHAISTRHGGVSAGRCASLNVSYTVDDDPANVDENLQRLSSALGATREQLFAAYQVHGNSAVVVDSTTPDRPRCDILLTRTTERVLMLRYADCTPIVLVDPVRRAAGLVHAGWRGTAVRAASTAVAAMQDAFGSNPRDIVAGIGPAIGPCCYTVGQDVLDAFSDRPWAIVRGTGAQARLDLWEANRRSLVDAGVPESGVELSGICTRCESERFFSHRANGGQPAGRFAALLAVTAHDGHAS